jgi:hypothetical protein
MAIVYRLHHSNRLFICLPFQIFTYFLVVSEDAELKTGICKRQTILEYSAYFFVANMKLYNDFQITTFVIGTSFGSKDHTRDGWIKEFIKRKWSSGLFWAVEAAEIKTFQQP